MCATPATIVNDAPEVFDLWRPKNFESGEFLGPTRLRSALAKSINTISIRITYDLKPEMSASEVTDAICREVEKGETDVFIINFANADMVGHSGKIEPTVKAVETVDGCLAEIEKAVRAKGGAMLITADHGNAEMMIDPATGGPHTAHTTNPVPFIVIAENSKQFTLKPNGSLRDISPTILGMLKIPQPKEMTGQDLRISTPSK